MFKLILYIAILWLLVQNFPLTPLRVPIFIATGLGQGGGGGGGSNGTINTTLPVGISLIERGINATVVFNWNLTATTSCFNFTLTSGIRNALFFNVTSNVEGIFTTLGEDYEFNEIFESPILPTNQQSGMNLTKQLNPNRFSINFVSLCP